MSTRLLVTIAALFIPILANGQVVDEEYEIYSGDFNGDGRLDLFFKYKPKVILLHGDIIIPIVIPPDIGSFILQQTPDQRLNIETDISAASTSGQLVESLELIFSDFNIDGKLDLFIKDIHTVPNMIGIDDHIIFAPSAARPISAKAFDTEAQRFFKELNQAYYNPDYFTDNATPLFENQTFITTLFVPEYCGHATVEEMEQADPSPIIDWDSEPTEAEATAYALAECAARWGPDFNVHYDFVQFRWTEAVQVGWDFSAFSNSARSASAPLQRAVDNGVLPEGSNDKIDLETILEQILGVDIFGPDLDDDDEFGRLLNTLIFLARNDINKAVIPGAVSCSSTPANINFTANFNTHFTRFRANTYLSSNSKITVTSNPANNEIAITVSVTVDNAAGARVSNVLKAIKSWSTCGVTPDGTTITLTANAEKASIIATPDITLNTQIGAKCRDSAQLGGRVINNCLNGGDVEQMRVAMHEFGHILGFANVYTDASGAEPGFERDIMATRAGNIYPYHLLVLAQKYGGQ